MTDDIFKIKPSKAANIEKYEDFTIYGVNKVIDKLRMLQKGRRIITAYFDEGRQSLMTAIIDLLPEKNLLILDYGPNDEINKQLLASPKIIFKANLNGVTAQFSVRGLQNATYQKQSVFACSIPEQMLWIQRRDTYRVRTQYNSSITVALTFESGRSKHSQVLDISAGGLSIEDAEMDEEFALGKVFEGCTLELGDFGEGRVAMEVRDHLPMRRHKSSSGRRIGFMFHKLPHDLEARIQRFILSVDAQRRRTLEEAKEQ